MLNFNQQLAKVFTALEPALNADEHERRLSYFNKSPLFSNGGNYRDDTFDGTEWNIQLTVFNLKATKHGLEANRVKRFKLSIEGSRLLSVYEKTKDGRCVHRFERKV
jgi:hypothetical protein